MERYIFIVIVSLIFASAIKCLVDSENKKEFLFRRSRCSSCHKELRGSDLIPIFSYLFKKGRCSYCNQKIPLDVFLYEIFTFITIVLFIIFGTLSFSAFDKVVIGVINDNYENPVISGTVNRGGLANLLSKLKKDGDFAKQMYKNLSGAKKVEFIIEKHDEPALLSVLKLFEKNNKCSKISIDSYDLCLYY